MKKFIYKISTLILAVLILCTVIGCSKTENEEQPKLATPEVVISYGGLAVWGEVENALHYLYVIDDGAEKAIGECKLQLEENQTLKVKAVSGKDGYLDSDYSAPQKYVKGEASAHDHIDVNDDGVCDKCSESVTVELSFYAINDLHGKIMDNDSQPGVDELTTYIKNLYADDAREEILLSSGDMWQGTVESSSNKGNLMTEWMNDIGFASMTLGNHEYDWGAEAIAANGKIANFPILGINVTQDGKPVDYCQGSAVVERGGIKIGIIGAIGNCLSSISGDFSGGLEFATGSKLTSLVKAESERLRNEEGCEFIVMSIHDGYDTATVGVTSITGGEIRYYDTSLSNGYIDLVFEGHTHKRYILQDEYGVYHLQGGGENGY